jgi:hypothetical protein
LTPARIAEEFERAPAQPRLDDVIGNEARADMLGLGAHLLHQPGALDGLREAGIVLHVGRYHQLPARLEARDQQRLEHGARGVDRRRIAGRPGADHDDAGVERGLVGWRHDRVSGPRERRRNLVIMRFTAMEFSEIPRPAAKGQIGAGDGVGDHRRRI